MSIDYAKLRVDEIREMLLEHLTEEEVVQIKGKADLVSKHQEIMENENQESVEILEDIEFADADEELVDEQSNVPNYYSPEWSKFIASQLTEDELYDGKYPKLIGLRRLTEKFLGPIMSAGPISLNTILDDSQIGRANCIYEIQVYSFISHDGTFHGTPIEAKVFRGAGGASCVNVEDELFRKFPEAMAETRAAARTFRNALRLDLVAYEEILGGKEKYNFELADIKEGDVKDKIQSHQKIAIRSLSDKLNIDVDKLLNGTPLENLPYQQAVSIIEKLNSYQGSDKKSDEIPGEIKK